MKKLAALLLAFFLLLTVPGAASAKSSVSYEQAGVDLMLVVTHPGDEYLYLGGVLPYYATELGYSVVVVYMTSADETQREEATAALRKMGVYEAPVFGTFPDKYSERLDIMEECWNPEDVLLFLVQTIRQYQPAVIVSHDLDGEYGHAAHMLTAKQTLLAAKKAAASRFDTESAEKYGVWQALRVFLHLCGDRDFTIDRNAALSSFSGKTALEAETALYRSFSEKYRYNLNVGDPTYSVAEYGLAYCAPGLETLQQSNDFFYGLSPSRLNGPGLPCFSSLSAAAIDSAAAETQSNSWDEYFRSKTDPAEVVIEDWENEHWEYRTDDLSIIVDRIHTTNIGDQPVCYSVAQIRMRNEDAFRPGVRGTDPNVKLRVEAPTYMARRYNAVLAITGDNLDVAEPEIKGIIMRDGVLYNNLTGADTAALYPDLSLRIFSPGETTYEKLLSDGVLNTFSFGPTLIRDGVLNINAKRTMLGAVNPRTGIGMVEPGHFVVITVDGRMSNYSRGVSVNTLMHMFYLYGCQQAYNLDGGNSTAMVFMGEHLNRHAGEPASRTGQRFLPDMLMWGYSEQVPSVDDPVYHDSSPED